MAFYYDGKTPQKKVQSTIRNRFEAKAKKKKINKKAIVVTGLKN